MTDGPSFLPGPERKRQVWKGTEHITAQLDVALFARRWRRLMAQGKVDTGVIRRIRKGEGHAELRVEDLEMILRMAQAFVDIEKVVNDRQISTPIQRYLRIREMIKSTIED